jgi:Ca2+-binding RTX toxin-like protein
MRRRTLGMGLALALGATLVVAPIAVADTRHGTQGPDVLIGTAGPDRIIALGGNDLLAGAGGDDFLYGGKGSDGIDAGDGDDFVFSRDGEADAVDCGAGNDMVVADTLDTLTGCETRMSALRLAEGRELVLVEAGDA